MHAGPLKPHGPAGIYIHIPFCLSRCDYCDFVSFTGKEDLLGSYLDALEEELSYLQPGVDMPVDTLYLGGGTPSLLNPDQIRRIIDAVDRRYRLPDDAEISMEANPDDLDVDILRDLLSAGVTRISVGVQSLDDKVLRGAGRRHDAATATAILTDARAAGFDRVGADLILGLPGEDPNSFPDKVNEMLQSEPDHLSLYMLEADKETPLRRQIVRGQVTLADDELLVGALLQTWDLLELHGLRQYEISNFSLPGCESRHNLKYWLDLPYAGFGAAAHGYYGGVRYANVDTPEGYIAAVGAGEAVRIEDDWDPGRRAEEALFMGLRLVSGIDLDQIGVRYGYDLWHIYAGLWEANLKRGDMIRTGSRLRLSRQGMIRSDMVFSEIVGRIPARGTEEGV